LLAFLPKQFPHLTNRITAEPLHFYGEIELGEYLRSSPFAAHGDWEPFVRALLAGLPPDVDHAELSRRLSTLADGISAWTDSVWTGIGLSDLPLVRRRQFVAEAIRMQGVQC
jgi:hypothetical protein